MTFPTADQVALAVVEACRLTDEDPIALIEGERGHKARARYVALAALIETFPDARKVGLARVLSFATPASGVSNLKHNIRGLKWWRDDWVDEVVGALVGEDEEDAADAQPVVTPAPARLPPPAFRHDERLIIHRLWKRGEEPAAIAAAIGAEAHEIDAYARAWPDRCRPRGQA